MLPNIDLNVRSCGVNLILVFRTQALANNYIEIKSEKNAAYNNAFKIKIFVYDLKLIFRPGSCKLRCMKIYVPNMCSNFIAAAKRIT